MQKQKRLPAEKRKRVILRAAIDIFSESNFRVAKMSDIAARAGVTEPMIYKFFQSKSDLFLEILKTTSKIVLKNFSSSQMVGEDELASTAAIRKNIETSMWSYLGSMDRHYKEIKIYYQAISEVDDPEVKRVIREAYQSYASFYESILQEGIEKNKLSLKLSPRMIAWDIVGFCIQQSTLFVMGFYDEKETRKLLAQRVEMWLP